MLRYLRKRRAGWSVGRCLPLDGNMLARRFPPPWTVEELDACFVVIDSTGQRVTKRTDQWGRLRMMSGSTSENITPMPSPNSKATTPRSIAEKMPVGARMVSESIPNLRLGLFRG